MSEVRNFETSRHFYKIYHLDKFGSIKKSALVMASDDDDALRQAGNTKSDYEVEVWDRSRFIGSVGGKPLEQVA